ncbi:CPXCG motif-containing cysteine-rich protein [Maribacter sp. MMG018]|uniref:CPXCG motif-containing cysteine-rich protein n=1 Tax=Maribacter sp. MMG018 TaxID=2822688 RepID=UPI001B384904|nr:CPXCG motif-containing cysteine-rich protein [Maribacter sp. MMG018]MBQ4912895.1 CPXCG motif-containing cysteine-rich protein [Maribacter sp. MMG018]
MYEHFFQCPYCWEDISMLMDPSVPQQSYVEDCEVCCNPIEVVSSFLNNELISFEAREIGQ